MSVNPADIADDLDILARKLERGFRDGDLTADAAGLASVLRHAAETLRGGRLDSGRVVGRRIADRALDAYRDALRGSLG